MHNKRKGERILNSLRKMRYINIQSDSVNPLIKKVIKKDYTSHKASKPRLVQLSVRMKNLSASHLSDTRTSVVYRRRGRQRVAVAPTATHRDRPDVGRSEAPSSCAGSGALPTHTERNTATKRTATRVLAHT